MTLQEMVVEILNVPTFLTPYLKTVYTNEDMALIHCLKEEVLSKEEIEERLGKEAENDIDYAYKTAVLNKVLDGENVKYKVNPLTLKINNVATFHRDKWESIPVDDRKKISQWHFEKFMVKKRNTTLEEMLKNKNTVLPLDEAIAYLKTVEEEINVIPCDCKSTMENCDFDRNVCIDFRHGINTPTDRGYGKKISKEEAVELLKHAEKEGLIHTGEEHAICNCCSCCCYPLRASEEMELKGKWPMVNYVIEMDTEKCVNCGICIKRCQLDVFEKKEKTITMDVSKCLGCGICTSTCPKQALKLIKIK